MVVSNTSPLNYLIQIGAAHLLPVLHGTLHVPQAVVEELTDPAAPEAVRQWMAAPPDWFMVHTGAPVLRPDWSHLHRGEAAAIALALEEKASLLLMDDLEGRTAARASGLNVIGTLGVLDLAAGKGHLDFKSALQRLQATNFRASVKLVQALLAKHSHDSVG